MKCYQMTMRVGYKVLHTWITRKIATQLGGVHKTYETLAMKLEKDISHIFYIRISSSLFFPVNGGKLNIQQDRASCRDNLTK